MIDVSSRSSLVETCGVCGTQRGQLLSPNGQITAIDANLEEKQAFVTSYRVPVSDHVLRPVRHECGKESSKIQALFLLYIETRDIELNQQKKNVFNLLSVIIYSIILYNLIEH